MRDNLIKRDDAPEQIFASRGDDGWRWPRASKFPEQGPHENVKYVRADRFEQLEEKVEQWKAGFALADAKWGKVLMERGKAVKALRELVTCVEDGCYCSEAKMAGAMDDARTVLAELEGGE